MKVLYSYVIKTICVENPFINYTQLALTQIPLLKNEKHLVASIFSVVRSNIYISL